MPTPYLAVMGQLYKELVEDSLTEYSYDAELAGLQYNIAHYALGIDVEVSGYNDKMAVLLEKVLISMRDLEVKDDRFGVIKERLMRGYKNFDFTDPYRQITSYSRWLITNHSIHNFQLLEELKTVTAQDVRQFFPQLLNQMHIEILVHGNLYKEDALRITDLIENSLKTRPLPPAQWPTKRCIMMHAGGDFRYEHVLKNPDNINHCIEYTIFLGHSQDMPTRAKLLLLAQMADEPVFDTLRTKEQLGYVVGSNAVMYSTVAAWRVLIQSEKDCAYLEARIEVFLVGFMETIRNMPEEEFEAHKVGLINRRLEKLKNLDQETNRFWSYITDENFHFDRGEVWQYLDSTCGRFELTRLFAAVYQDVENIEPLTKQDMLEYFEQFYHPQSLTRAKAAIYLIAQSSAADLANKTSDTEKREKLVQSIVSMFEQMGLNDVNASDLTQRISKIDLSAASNVDNITSAVEGFMKETLGVAAEQVDKVLEQGKTVIAQVLPSLGIVTASKNEGDVAGNGEVNGEGEAVTNKKKTIVIEDVKAFKASMPLSVGPRAVKELSEFEELGAKL